MDLLDDPWALPDPKRAFADSAAGRGRDLADCPSTGLERSSARSSDQIHLIFLPGQADHHYQHLAARQGPSASATAPGGDGRGGKDHSWGPRNWHAKIYLRWLIASIDDDNGFMLSRAVGPTKQTQSGFVLATASSTSSTASSCGTPMPERRTTSSGAPRSTSAPVSALVGRRHLGRGSRSATARSTRRASRRPCAS